MLRISLPLRMCRDNPLTSVCTLCIARFSSPLECQTACRSGRGNPGNRSGQCPRTNVKKHPSVPEVWAVVLSIEKKRSFCNKGRALIGDRGSASRRMFLWRVSQVPWCSSIGCNARANPGTCRSPLRQKIRPYLKRNAQKSLETYRFLLRLFKNGFCLSLQPKYLIWV